MMTYFQDPDNDERFISWNGSATFHTGYFTFARLGDNATFFPTDVFTVYGKDSPGGACTVEEALHHAKDHFAEGWICNHCQVIHTADMAVGHEDEHGKTCKECWKDNQ